MSKKTTRVMSVLSWSLLLISTSISVHAADLQGAVPKPLGMTSESVTQLQVHFPEPMIKSDAFKITCQPEVAGFASWANNDTIYTYNFKAKNSYQEPRLPGGASCEVVQTEDVQSIQGKKWKAGTINYSVQVDGPKVQAVLTANDFQGSLHAKEPVVLIVFDGDIDRQQFFSQNNNYLSYSGGNATAEKMTLVELPKDKMESVFQHLKRTQYVYDAEWDRKNWVLATVGRSLIPGAEVNLNIKKVMSAYNSKYVSSEVYNNKFHVRDKFKAEVKCASSSPTKTLCLPESSIQVNFNGKVKWTDVKDSYLEYIPYQSKEKKTEKAYPVLPNDSEEGYFNTAVNLVSVYIPALSRFSDTLVESIRFDVKVEPETNAKIVLAKNLKDIEDRALSNASGEFPLRIGSMSEMLKIPPQLSIFEKKAGGNLALPVALVNLNQKVIITKLGKDSEKWKPLKDISSIIHLVREYEARGDYRKTKNYVSPLAQYNPTKVEMNLKGEKNRPAFLQVPFSPDENGQVGGVYALEVSVPSYEKSMERKDPQSYLNPSYTLAQVTNLSVHIKKGHTKTLLWVTTLSDGLPVPNAKIDIYNCLGEMVKTSVSDKNGLASIDNQEWASTCGDKQSYSDYFSPNEFYAVAKTKDDFTLTHSSWVSARSYSSAQLGLSYYYSDIVENSPFFHSVIGVNLAKPGQKVPVEIYARWPQAKGFLQVPSRHLPARAKIVNVNDDKIYYEFDLNWNSDRALFTWNIPSDTSVKYGKYDIRLVGPEEDKEIYFNSQGGIEVAEFKIPLMTGALSFPASPLVLPSSIPVNGFVRLANGVGAKDLGVNLSYYFEPTELSFKDYGDFIFGNGVIRLQNQEVAVSELPNSNHPETINNLRTNNDGIISRDLASEKLSNGKTIEETLKSVEQPQKLVTRLKYQDQMGEFQTVSQGTTIYHSSSFVGTKLVSGEVNKSQLHAVVVDVAGKNITRQSQLDAELFSITSKTISEILYGGMVKSTVERELTKLPQPLSCDNGEIIKCSFKQLSAGIYAVQFSDKSTQQSSHLIFKVDKKGRVYGESEYYYEGDEDTLRQLPLALDKNSYRNGEKAVVSFPAPYKTCSALATLERSDVMEAFVVQNACEKGSIEIPVDASLAPNAFVSVYLISGRLSLSNVDVDSVDLGRPSYRLGYANMKVDWSKYKANVAVKLNKEKYGPREEVQAEISVKGEQGDIENGRVTLIAIEEKILSLRSNETYKILEAMMQLRNHDVMTVTPFEKIKTPSVGGPQDAAGELRQARKGGDEGGDGSAAAQMKRQIFDALVTFQADVPVVNGVARLSFKTNDSLSKFKVIAIASSSNHKFGMADAVYLNAKDTQTYSNIPNLVYSEDKFPIRVTLQNNTSKGQRYRTVVKAISRDEKGDIVDTKEFAQNYQIDKSTSAAVQVGEMAIPEGAYKIEYVVQVYDQSGGLVDSMSPDVQTVFPTIPLAVHHSYLRQVEASRSLQLQLNKEPNALMDRGEIRAIVANSLVNGAIDQINKKVKEDRFADFLIESKIYQALLKSSQSNVDGLKKVLGELVNYLDDSGLVKYYPQATRGDIWLTASLIHVLQSEKWAMSEVPSAVLKKWRQAIHSVLSKKIDPVYIGSTPVDWIHAQTVMGTAAFSVNDKKLELMAQQISRQLIQDLAANKNTYGSLDKWTTRALVDLWLLEVYTDPEKALQSDRLKVLTQPSRLVYAGNSALLTGTAGYSGMSIYSDKTLETSKLLDGISRLKGSPDLARALAAGLISASAKDWYGLRTVAFIYSSLKSFERNYEAEGVTGSSTIEIVEERQSQTIDWNLNDKQAGFNVAWKSPKDTVVVKHQGSGLPWVSVQGLTAVPLMNPQGQGLSLEKEIKNLTTGTTANFQPGDLIEVTIKIHAAAPTNHVALQDPIPAGSNIVGEFYSQSYGPSFGEKSYRGYKLYFEQLAQGYTEMKYQYQLNNPGSFKLPPTRAESIYIPSVYGEYPNSPITVNSK